jgi:hypothetical protein
MRVFENRMLSTMFGPKGRKWREAGEDYIMRNFKTCEHGNEPSGSI